ncbi:MAG: hypothetical protein R3B09_02485 [Nannocystaceae bacterium]
MIAWLLPSTLLAAALPPVSGGGFSEAGRLTAGSGHTCVLLGDRARCWGSNRSGQLGDGTREDRSTPTPVVGLADAIEIVAGWEHTCARLRDRSVVCWGANDEAQLGDGLPPEASRKELVLRRRRGDPMPARLTPGPVVGLGPADRLVLAGSTSCALVGGEIWCWGAAFSNRARDEPTPKPRRIAGFAGVEELAVGGAFVCARTGGQVTCAAEDPTTWSIEAAPSPLTGVDDAVALASGGGHLCVLRSSGGVTCFGGIRYRYDRDQDRRELAWRDPVPITELTDAVALTSGWSHACALRRGGELRCWGGDLDGQLGHGLFQPWRRPVAVLDVRKPRAVAGGSRHTCALSEGGAVLCWGANDTGQLGWEPPKVEVPELQPGRRGRDEATWQLREILRASATPVVALEPPT